jgi:cytochrome c oxidase subunit 2
LRLHLSAHSRRIGMAAVALCMLLAVSGCGGPRASHDEDGGWGRLAEPVGATDRTAQMHSLWMWSWLAAILVGVLVWGLILYSCVKFRRRRDDEIPVQTRYNLPIEILYTVAPVIIVLVLFYFTVTVQNHTLAPVSENNAKADHTVTVVGQQWSWTFNYDQDPALDGKTTVFESGTPAHQPTLELPVNKSVEIHLHSPDVDHSFWVPAFLFKMDVIPGRDNHFSFTPTRKGTFQGRCAELCGTYHSRMLFNVKVVSEADYAAYLKKLEQQGNIGPALGRSGVDEESGLNQGEGGQQG